MIQASGMPTTTAMSVAASEVTSESRSGVGDKVVGEQGRQVAPGHPGQEAGERDDEHRQADGPQDHQQDRGTPSWPPHRRVICQGDVNP